MAEKVAEDGARDARAVPTASIPSGDHTVWADASPLLEAATKDLQDGELIHGDNFNLFAAMSALEIMDPKMDSGIVCRYYSVDEAIENGAAPVPFSFNKTIDVQCTIDLMDHLLACEATWHKGHSLAQTVYSCIYLLRPERTSSHALLDSYCRIIRATCNAVISVVSDARTHEEEDLFTMAHGLPLKLDRDEKCLSMLNAVEETISRQLRACKAPSYKKRVLEDIEPLQCNPDLEEGYCKALLCRLRFRKHFYHVLVCMRRPQGRGLDLARKHIAFCLAELECIVKSAEFLRSSSCGTREDGVDYRTTASCSEPVGFDASLNCRLSAPTPPRAIQILSWKRAVEYFKKLLHDLDIVCSHSMDTLLEGVLGFVVQFQKSQPDLVARAHLQLLLVQDGKLYGWDPMFAVISRAASLPEVVKNYNIQNNESVVQLGQLELAFNKDFGEMSSLANDENAYISKRILIWVEEQTYWIASRFLFLGFELELYSPSEYCMVYWYIYAALIKLAEKTHIKTVTSNDAAKRRGKKKRDSPKDVARDYHIPPAVLFLQCHICLAEGLTLMLAALRNENKLFQNPSPFNTEHETFIQHFELLQKACIPEHVSYIPFKESTSHARFSTLLVYNYFKDAQRIAKELRSSFSNDPDRMAELRQIEQVAEHNGIALNVIGRVGALDPSLKVTFEFSYHPYFAIAVVKRS
ncbi:uncharacterized protein LOC131158213 isoform X2 [Malania oleifera]|uniref:uncharacterized protein LOC131158213 isoform X2 n=1 Tax=Malania oleifera TaxID=397392 RepID=UPI0025ADBD9C|nr:uncharacterized protein LOC131158213 isoform X2 [Malania oleifera]